MSFNIYLMRQICNAFLLYKEKITVSCWLCPSVQVTFTTAVTSCHCLSTSAICPRRFFLTNIKVYFNSEFCTFRERIEKCLILSLFSVYLKKWVYLSRFRYDVLWSNFWGEIILHLLFVCPAHAIQHIDIGLETLWCLLSSVFGEVADTFQ